ncbi:MAG: hypothetical protein WCK53_15845 [Methanomicrobiales archaeon]
MLFVEYGVDNIWKLTGEGKAGLDTIMFWICKNCCQVTTPATWKGTRHIGEAP